MLYWISKRLNLRVVLLQQPVVQIGSEVIRFAEIDVALAEPSLLTTKEPHSP